MSDVHDDPNDYWTYDEAMSKARAEATRDLNESGSVISYVAYLHLLEDFYRCEFQLEPECGWVHSCRRLTIEERLPDEQITDARIRELAHSGNVIAAVGLYRTRYDVGLTD